MCSDPYMPGTTEQLVEDTRARLEAYKKTNMWLDKILPAILWILLFVGFVLSIYYSHKNVVATADAVERIQEKDFAIREAETAVLNETQRTLRVVTPLLEKLTGVQSNARIENR